MSGNAPPPAPFAIVIGASSGIGLEVVRQLLDAGWRVRSLARRPLSLLSHDRLQHTELDVLDEQYVPTLRRWLQDGNGDSGLPDAVIHCAGTGEEFDPAVMANEVHVMRVNLVSMVAALEVFLPAYVAARRGHFIGLSSLTDVLHVARAPAYAASKAGVSSYLESIGLAVRRYGVAISNVRFGFVDTRMANAPVKPLMIPPEAAARVVLRCLRTRRLRVSYPRRMAWLVGTIAWFQRWRVWWSRGPQC